MNTDESKVQQKGAFRHLYHVCGSRLNPRGHVGAGSAETMVQHEP